MAKQQQFDYLIEDSAIARAELRTQKWAKEDKYGKVVKVFKPSVIEKRIENRIITEIQKRTYSINIPQLEDKAINIVKNKLQELGIQKIDNKIHSIAVAEECRKLIKANTNNEFAFTKKEILELAQTSSNNIYHLNQVLDNMSSKESRRFEELYITDDFKDVRKRILSSSFFPTLGEDYSLTSKDPDEKIIFRVNPDLLPYLVAPNKKKYENKGYIIVYNEILDNFEFIHSITMYKIATDIEGIWFHTKYSYKDIQKRFGTKYGVKKKIISTSIFLDKIDKISDDKYQDKDKDVFTVKIIDAGKKVAYYKKTQQFPILNNNEGEYFIKEKPEIDRFGDPVYDEDNNGDYIFEDNYKSTYRYFKRDILDKVINELNMPDKSPFYIKLIEHRERGRKGTPIEFIQFQITRKKNNKYNNMIRYSNLGYYAACRISFYNMSKGKDKISNLDEYGSELNKSFDNELFKKPIQEISSLEELRRKVKENYAAILEIKDILLENALELAHLYFSEDYLVVFNNNTSRNKYKLNERLGDDAVECLNVIKDKYKSILEKPDKIDPFLNFLPFEYYDDIKEIYIKITSKNLEEYRSQMMITIRHNIKKSFKKFKNRDNKKSFYEFFFRN